MKKIFNRRFLCIFMVLLTGLSSLVAETNTVDVVKIEAVPAYNIQHLRDGKNPFHPKGRGNGYILGIDGIRFYFAGDTENVPELKGLQNIDVAFLPFNLPYTMDKEMFEDLAKSIKAKYLYPYHTMGTDQKSIESIEVPESIVRIRKFEK